MGATERVVGAVIGNGDSPVGVWVGAGGQASYMVTGILGQLAKIL